MMAQSSILSLKAVVALMSVLAGWSLGSNAHYTHPLAGDLTTKGNNGTPACPGPGNTTHPIKPPSGARSGSLQMSGDQEVALFQTKDATDEWIEHTFIVIHGELSDAGRYWTRMNDAIDGARAAGFPNTDRNIMVVAPILFSDKHNCGEYTDKQLAWRSANSWGSGDVAKYPKGTNVTSFDVLDELIQHFSHKSKYPRLANVTIVGQSAGGQLTQRYVAVTKEPRSHGVHVRYIHANPSSYSYFTDDRPTIPGEEMPSRNNCSSYNTWRYGFDKFPGTHDGLEQPEEYFRRYISRDVVSMVGYQDIQEHGGQTCMAQMQGGHKRRNRSLSWYQYINGLARTSTCLDGFPAQFDGLPDWSSVANNSISTRIMILKDVGHDFVSVFATDGGRSALFSDGDLLPSWKPGQP